MSQEGAETQDANGGGQQPETQAPERTFTQAELEAQLSERIKREREKYKDYGELKRFRDEHKSVEERDREEKAAIAAERDDYRTKFQKRLVKDDFREKAELAGVKLSLITAAYKVAFADNLLGEVGDNDTVSQHDFKRLLAENPEFAVPSPNGRINPGAGRDQPMRGLSGSQQLDRQIREKLGLPQS